MENLFGVQNSCHSLADDGLNKTRQSLHRMIQQLAIPYISVFDEDHEVLVHRDIPKNQCLSLKPHPTYREPQDCSSEVIIPNSIQLKCERINSKNVRVKFG
ncbi:hypothetical protein LOAG_12645 [Loa loa]|uniref:Uncharacterized protein n=1 Tax=Loa loa TaxID=7209 RepID=A0A1S0TLA5_LOALO|nr:hypothetical protein LOAG_12645 [Loa loa]EFO15863.1 hypothetical protein LOAG_12645 [Loa loa]